MILNFYSCDEPLSLLRAKTTQLAHQTLISDMAKNIKLERFCNTKQQNLFVDVTPKQDTFLNGSNK